MEYEYEEGDRVWATSIPPAPEYIRTTASVSQWLAEAFQKNLSSQDYEKHIPKHLHGFDDVFSKDSFDELPESKPWDLLDLSCPDLSHVRSFPSRVVVHPLYTAASTSSLPSVVISFHDTEVRFPIVLLSLVLICMHPSSSLRLGNILSCHLFPQH